MEEKDLTVTRNRDAETDKQNDERCYAENMARDSDTVANDGYLADADAVVAGRHQKALAEIVGRLAGRGGQRRAAYGQIRDFMDDFQKWPSGEDRKPNEILTEMLKWLRHERIAWPIAPFLAWLCHYHKNEAAAFYQMSGLSARHDFAYRPFAGKPGDSAKARRTAPSLPAALTAAIASVTGTAAPLRDYAARDGHRATAHIIEGLRRDFLGRASYLRSINRFVERRRGKIGTDDGLLILKGPTGYGKSSLAAEWCGRNDGSDGIEVVAHFIAASYPETRAFDAVFTHLAAEIARRTHQEFHAGHARAQFVDYLSNGLPDGRPLVVWIDGLDEALPKVEPFIPEALHESVCLIVSGGGQATECPAWLANLINHPYLDNYRIVMIDLEGFTDADMKLVADRIFARAGVEPICERELACLSEYSHSGFPLLVAHIAQDAVKDRKELRPWERTDDDFWTYLENAENPNATGRFIEQEVKVLKSQPFWKDYGDFFRMMTVLREPVTAELLAVILDHARGFTPIPSLELVPAAMMRWLDGTVVGDRKMISFAPSYWREWFGHLVGDHKRYEVALCSMMEGYNPTTQNYWLRWRIAHLCNTQQAEAAYDILRGERYYSHLEVCLGEVKALHQAVADMRIFWQRGQMTFREEADDIDDLLPDLIDTVHYHTRRLGVDPETFAGGKPSYF